MLEKERFLAIKKLARDIREDNKKLFKSFKKMPFDEAVENKNSFIKSVIENMNIAFSDGEQGREEKQMFRANILIPDDKEFYESYTEDKNIRNLMNKYAVSIEDIMSKITELNIYSKYLDEFSNGEDIYSNAYILNDKLEIINENLEFNLYSSDVNVILQVENANPWYEDSKCKDELCHRIFKIEDNKIYYLVSKLKDDYQEGDYGVLEERVYTINDNKLTYEVINTYNITEMGNII